MAQMIFITIKTETRWPLREAYRPSFLKILLHDDGSDGPQLEAFFFLHGLVLLSLTAFLDSNALSLFGPRAWILRFGFLLNIN